MRRFLIALKRVLLGFAALIVLFAVVLYILVPPYANSTARAKIQEATNFSNPARTAIGVACSERASGGYVELGTRSR